MRPSRSASRRVQTAVLGSVHILRHILSRAVTYGGVALAAVTAGAQ